MPRAKKVDELLLAASDIVAGWIRHATIPEERIAGVVHRLHVQLQRMNDRTYTAWEEAALPPDVLDAAEEERAGRDAAVPTEIKVYPPPMHPLAAPGVTTAQKEAGTIGAEAITCLECGKDVKLLKTHLKAMHDGMTWAEYLDRHALPTSYPAAPEALVEKQRAQMKKFRTDGERLPPEKLVRKPKKNAGLRTNVTFQGDTLRDVDGDDRELRKTG
jgi:predicted transcriptional regulator